jgi:hypothetical protein
VPLSHAYSTEPLQDVLTELVATRRAPAYVVHFAQKAAVERAQSLPSVQVAPKEQREAIARRIAGFSFSKGFGTTLSRLLRLGIGVHHAGMLPRYRRLVEQLTQEGLLSVGCGTDTLGVGINVPIRTVVFTSLTKFDGERMRHLTAREFHQIAGRAGRAGYDTLGEVIVQAPDHVIENAKALARAGDDERKRRKIVRKKAPAGQVNWTDKTFERSATPSGAARRQVPGTTRWSELRAGQATPCRTRPPADGQPRPAGAQPPPAAAVQSTALRQARVGTLFVHRAAGGPRSAHRRPARTLALNAPLSPSRSPRSRSSIRIAGLALTSSASWRPSRTRGPPVRPGLGRPGDA